MPPGFPLVLTEFMSDLKESHWDQRDRDQRLLRPCTGLNPGTSLSTSKHCQGDP